MKKISFRNDVLPLKNQLFRLALRITLDRAEAEDIVQETLIKVWERLNRPDGQQEIDSIEAFCYTICRNLSLDRIRKSDYHNESIDQTRVDATDSSLDPNERAEQQDKLRLVRQFVDQLPEKQRSCMQLRDFEGKPYREIARILQITEEQVKVNIFRARKTIKQRFEQADKYVGSLK